MLATTLAIALALAPHEPPAVVGTSAQAADNAAAATQTFADVSLVPFGQAFGSFEYGPGKLLALLEDASGTPLWVLDATMYENGVLDGDLLPLEYATSPILPILQLTVSGQVLLDQAGNGSFYAVIFQLGGGAIPVFPVGKIEGVIQQTALAKFLPTISGASDLVATSDSAGTMQAYGPQVSDSSIIVCPKGRIDDLDGQGSVGQGGFGLAGVSSTSGIDTLVHQQDGGLMFLPTPPQFGVDQAGSMGQANSGLAGLGTSGAASALGHQHDDGPIVLPTTPQYDVDQAGSMGQAGHDVLNGGGIIFCPKAPDQDASSQGTMGQAGAGLANGGVIVCPWGGYADVQSAGSMAQAGSSLQGSGGGQPLMGPSVSTSSGNDGGVLTSAGAKRESAQFETQSQGPSHARVALRWWLDH